MLKRIAAALLVCATFGLPVSVQATDHLVTAKFEDQLGQAKSSMMSDPASALRHARAAAVVAKDMPAKDAAISKATSQWLEGEALTRLNKAKEAEPVITEALTTVAQVDPNSKLHADLLKSKAAIVGQVGKVETALTILHNAYKIYERLGETRSQAIILHNIATIYYEARDYTRVLNYYSQAEKVYSDDPILSVSAHNNLGNTYRDMKKFADAEREYQQALAIARDMESPLLEARILNNLAYSQFAQKRYSEADQTALRGLDLSSAAADWKPFLWGTRARIALDRNRIGQAEQFIKKALVNVDPKTSQMEYRDHHASAYEIYQKLGRPQDALTHLEAYKRLDDNGRNLAASTNSSLLTAQFDEANRELRISKLEAKQAQREMALAESQTKLRYAMVVLAVALFMVGVLFIVIRSIRRQRKKVSDANALLSHTAKHDLLTGLANRAYYRDILTNAVEEDVSFDQRCAVMLIDLDRFKNVNDTLGHEVGDKLLCEVAEQLKRAGGSATSAVRLGGDEFALVIPNCGSSDDILALGESVIESLSQTRQISGVSVDIGATIGVAVAPDDGDTVAILTRRADLALYHGKKNGRGLCVRYLESMQMEADERHILEADLRQALANGELSIAYQSIVCAESEEPVAYEALLRWDHPTRGQISPDIFIPIAEDARIINQIGSWVLRTSCAEAKKWPAHVRLSVNVSALQVEGGGLSNSIVSALASSGLDPEQLELEVTESVFLGKRVEVEQILEGLRSLGIRLVLDDFGTGYSSLGYLQRANFSAIKIDRSFVKSATKGSSESLAIIRAIVSMAQELGMETTAEGVESDGDVSIMKNLGCSQLQGYHFSRPTKAVSGENKENTDSSTIVALSELQEPSIPTRKVG